MHTWIYSESLCHNHHFLKSQVIKKEDLAKYFSCAELLRPDIVSKGGEKCMSFFAGYIDAKYQNTPEYFNDEFYKMAICFAIMFMQIHWIVE